MRTLGFLLVTVGLCALLYGGFRVIRLDTVLQVESIRSSDLDSTALTYQPMVAGIALVGGLLLLLPPHRRAARRA